MASKLNLNVVICVLLVVILIVSILGMERSIKAAPYSLHILDAVVEEEDSTNFNESFYGRTRRGTRFQRGTLKQRMKKFTDDQKAEKKAKRAARKAKIDDRRSRFNKEIKP
tara:strand:- start:1265 stop:1597 length:333 start_codon:yes stop_codon:yes gene_type:complete